VFGVVERGGEIVTQVVPKARKKYIHPIIERNVYQLSRIMTDESKTYTSIGRKGFVHYKVNHKAKEYARGQVSTNTIEVFGVSLKEALAGLTGTFRRSTFSTT